MVTETEFDQLLDVVREFIRREVMPAEAGIDETDEIPARLIEQAKEMGLYGYALPAEYGGLGLSVDQQVRLTIELGYTCPAFRSLFGTNNGIAGQVLVLAGTEEQRKQWLPRLASGEVVASFALTEPDAGSDPAGWSPPRGRDDEAGSSTGSSGTSPTPPPRTRSWCSRVPNPDAPPGKGIGVFIVPARTDGVAVAARDHKMGQAGAWTADVAFTGVRVPADALIGEAAQAGYATAMRSLAHGRLIIAALCVGVAARLIDESVAYAKERSQGGHLIGEYQLVQAMLADSTPSTWPPGPWSCTPPPSTTRAPTSGSPRPRPSTSPARRSAGSPTAPSRSTAAPATSAASRRTPLPRRPAVPHLRGHQPDPAASHRPRTAPLNRRARVP